MSNSKLHSLSSRVLENGYCKTVNVINQIHILLLLFKLIN
jgi:hypothetical protein